MSNLIRRVAVLGLLVAVGSVQSAFAFKGPTTAKYCTELVVKKGITDVSKFQAEVKKCKADPTTYK